LIAGGSELKCPRIKEIIASKVRRLLKHEYPDKLAKVLARTGIGETLPPKIPGASAKVGATRSRASSSSSKAASSKDPPPKASPHSTAPSPSSSSLREKMTEELEEELKELERRRRSIQLELTKRSMESQENRSK
jgi:hypothetical protein